MNVPDMGTQLLSSCAIHLNSTHLESFSFWLICPLYKHNQSEGWHLIPVESWFHIFPVEVSNYHHNVKVKSRVAP